MTETTAADARAGSADAPTFKLLIGWKAIYVDFSGKLQRAQIDNQPG